MVYVTIDSIRFVCQVWIEVMAVSTFQFCEQQLKLSQVVRCSLWMSVLLVGVEVKLNWYMNKLYQPPVKSATANPHQSQTMLAQVILASNHIGDKHVYCGDWCNIS
jgi:hypothetical protein